MNKLIRNIIKLSAPIAASFLIILLFGISNAMPPYPGNDKEAAAGKATGSYYLDNLDELHQKGICVPNESIFKRIREAAQSVVQLSPAAPGDFNVLAILVEFSDEQATSSETLFDSLLYDTVGYTVRDYYRVISYDQVDLVTVNLPSSLNWQSAPQTYAYYVNNQNGTGSYPNNAQKLTEDLVTLVDPVVDFSNYDNDNDGYVDVVVVIHAGPGAERTGSNADIWSHKWSTFGPRATNDGVSVFDYTIQPEYINTPNDMTIGVFCHELGHAFGLPDLYDIDGSSYGVGEWCIMAYGSWGGTWGNRPTHPCAWSRIEMGFASSINISANTDSQSIQDVKSSGEIYRLWTSGNISDEYFLVENRQRTGYDTYLPAAGMLIWHIDDGKATVNNADNANEWYPGLGAANHFRVALEQADGFYDLEHGNDIGDAADVFPGSTSATSFNAVSATTSDSYVDGASFVAVDNISSPGATMLADLIVGFAAGVDDDPTLPDKITLSQNYPNPFNPGTRIEFYTSTNGRAVVEVYNIAGQKVKTILDETVSAGANAADWNGTDTDGQAVSSGIYLYKLSFSGLEQTKKMALIR